MVQPSTALSVEQCLEILQRLKTEGLPEEVHNELVANALAMLSDSDQAAKFEESIKESARLAKDIDDVFDQQAQILLAVGIIGFWPILILYFEWIGLKEQWRECLRFSCEVALDTAEVLKRFDQVYLAQVETITSNEDRLKAIAAIEPFILELERNDKSAEISRRFLNLKRDVAAFGERYLISATAVVVVPLTSDIKALDESIKSVRGAFGGILGGRVLVGLGVAGRASQVISSLQAYRQEKIEALRKVNQVTAGINSLVAEQPSSLLFEAPNIDLMLDNLLTFAEIWSSVRNQSVQFCEHLKGGLEAATSLRFKAEVKLAREVCTPLMEGLIEYNKQLRSWM
ncbi:reovirus sigma C capsid domain protein [Rhizoctonia solani]|uniref:Reovirus sigma C capsid domain protein n=1 Tax=Rhizoctonia solani TaxID=456999 RepID=A0A8H8NTA3_9AGAM|nr:reovirus sigma C capsid domain protein [Rhizoctonia solani]QRW18352.1 reovirus sigma C capsid domain protein [Rhizoctonia solani]